MQLKFHCYGHQLSFTRLLATHAISRDKCRYYLTYFCSSSSNSSFWINSTYQVCSDILRYLTAWAIIYSIATVICYSSCLAVLPRSCPIFCLTPCVACSFFPCTVNLIIYCFVRPSCCSCIVPVASSSMFPYQLITLATAATVMCFLFRACLLWIG